MKSLSWLLSITLLLPAPFYATAQESVGIFERHSDIGMPKLAGNTTYNSSDQTYTLSGAGANIWARNDQFQFAFKKVKGDFMMRATVHFIGKGAAAHRKIGLMARNALSATSAYADACVHGDGLSSLQYRTKDADTTGQVIVSS